MSELVLQIFAQSDILLVSGTAFALTWLAFFFFFTSIFTCGERHRGSFGCKRVRNVCRTSADCAASVLSLSFVAGIQVERVKRVLSTQHQARVEIESLYEGEDFSETLTRARFEEVRWRRGMPYVVMSVFLPLFMQKKLSATHPRRF